MTVDPFVVVAQKMAISETLTRFCLALDTEDWAMMSGVLDDDVVWESEMNGLISGREKVIENQRSSRSRIVDARHHLSNILIEVDGDTATSVSYVLGNDIFRDRPTDLVRIVGTYQDRLVKKEGTWLLVHRTFLRLWLDPH